MCLLQVLDGVEEGSVDMCMCMYVLVCTLSNAIGSKPLVDVDALTGDSLPIQ